MENHSTDKRNYVIPIILGIVIVVLTIAVLAQNRRINTLKKEMNNTTMTENTPSELITDNISSEKNQPPEDINTYKDKIKKLEKKVADMQAWQDYLEETLRKNEEDTNFPLPNRPAGDRFVGFPPRIRNDPAMRNIMRNVLSSRYNSFAEENNLPPEVQNKFIDLLFERENKIRNMMPGIRGLRSGRILSEDLQQELTDINAEYDEQISELLSEEDFIAFKEYQKVEPERMFIDQFKRNMFFGDTELEKQQEKELIAAMYNDRQNYEVSQKENVEEMIFSGNPLDRESIEERVKEGLENQNKLYSSYVESAKDILTESQMQKFETYIDMRKSSLEMIANRGPRVFVVPGKEEATK